MKRVLFFLSHPAQFHFAKNIINNLKNDGNEVVVLIKTKDILEELVRESGIEYYNIQIAVRKNNKYSMAFAALKRTIQVFKYAKRFKADILIGTDASVAQAARLLRKVSFTTLEDDADIIPKLVKVTYPYTTHILVPKVCDVGKWSYKKIGYDGYMKLAYLYPSYFVADEEIVRKYIKEGQYCLIRLAKLAAHHDVGIGGLSIAQVEKLTEKIEESGIKVYIHSEVPLSEKLHKNHLNIASSDIHHILAKALLLISDSQSMSMEAAMLGTPNIRFSDFAGRISVLEELEQKYELTCGIPSSDSKKLEEKVDEILTIPNLREEFQNRRQRMADDKIDVTAFFTWFIENYPESKRIMKENPDYQYGFK